MPKRVNPLNIESFISESTLVPGVGVLPGSADEGVALPGGGDGSSPLVVGVALHGALSGEEASIARDGNVLALVNANSVNIVRGDKLTLVATTGRFVRTVANNTYYFLEANEAASADGVLISCKIVRGFYGA